MKNKMDGENDQSPNELSHFAGGGMYDVDQGDSTTAKIPFIPQMPTLPPTPQGPVFKPDSGLPPTVSLPQVPAAVVPAPSAVSPASDLQSDLAGYKSGLSKYGPEQQMAVQEAITRDRTGLRQGLSNAGAGFGDVLVSLGGGQSNFQKNLQDRNDKTEEGMRSGMEKANLNKMAQIKAQMELSLNDPASPLSRSKQRAAAVTLGKLNWTPEQISVTPGNIIEEATKNGLSYFESKSKADEAKALHELQAGTAGRSLAEIHNKNQADEAARQATLAENKEKLKIEHPIATRVSDLLDNATQRITSPGTVTIKDSHGQTHTLPAQNLNKARQRDPGLQVIQ